MTGEEYLALSQDEKDEFVSLGREIAKYGNVNAIDDLTQRFLDAGLLDDAARVQGLKDDAITYMQDTIETLTGYSVEYNDNTQQWIFSGGQQNEGGEQIGGRFVGKLSFYEALTNDDYEDVIYSKFDF